MTASRLTKCVDIVRLWPFFVEGFAFVGKYRKYDMDVTGYRHTLQALVKTPNAWVGVTRDDSDEPLAFWCAREITPEGTVAREFEVFLRFHKPNHLNATLEVQKLFETWCALNGVKRYFMTVRRDATSGPRRFPADAYGVKKAYSVFMKEL